MIWYLIGGLIGIIFFKKKFHLSTWSAIGYGISLTLCVYFGVGAIAGFIASSTGIDEIASPWVYGLLFLVFLVVFIINIRRLRNHQITNDPDTSESIETSDIQIQEGRKFRKCPYCAEYILEEAVYCRYCKHGLSHQQLLRDTSVNTRVNQTNIDKYEPGDLNNGQKSDKTWIGILFFFLILIGGVFVWAVVDKNSNQEHSNATVPIITKTNITPTQSTILYTMNFTKNDGQWLEGVMGSRKLEISQGRYQITSHESATCPGSITGNKFTNAIFKIDLLGITDPTTSSSYSIMWRYDDVENYYGLFLTGSGEVGIYKVFQNEMSDLFKSDGPIVDTKLSKIPVHISYDGPYMQVFINGELITALFDSSIKQGGVGLALCTIDSVNGATATFDNLVIYSTTEMDKVLPKQNQPIATIQGNSEGKVIVTVINNFELPQEVYCDGLLIFNINPGETKTFEFEMGKWRIDLCYPGTFPCDNFDYVDLNYDEFTYEIRK